MSETMRRALEEIASDMARFAGDFAAGKAELAAIAADWSRRVRRAGRTLLR